jgi:hypothetical protein
VRQTVFDRLRFFAEILEPAVRRTISVVEPGGPMVTERRSSQPSEREALPFNLDFFLGRI